MRQIRIVVTHDLVEGQISIEQRQNTTATSEKRNGDIVPIPNGSGNVCEKFRILELSAHIPTRFVQIREDSRLIPSLLQGPRERRHYLSVCSVISPHRIPNRSITDPKQELYVVLTSG